MKRHEHATRPLPRGPRVLVAVLLAAAAYACGDSPGDSPTILQTLLPSDLQLTKTFTPPTIGPGSVSTLSFTIANSSGEVATNVAFDDVLPGGVVIASPANVTSTCTGGTLSAPDGGGTVEYSGGGVGADSNCSITVDVTSSSVGVHSNVSGALTSDGGVDHGSASADLTVDAGRPGFTKSFSPSTIAFGARSTLTFTIDNSANGQSVTSLSFTDNLPDGIDIAAPTNQSTTCPAGTLTANPGQDVVSYSFNGFLEVLAAGATCTIDVDVVGNSLGALGNTSGDLTAFVGGSSLSSGKAAAVLNVTVDPLIFSKSFTDDPASPGGTVTLAFTITNLSRSESATNIAFTDDLDAVLSGLAATGLPAAVCGGTLSGTSTLSFSGGSLAAEATCTFSVTLQLPADATGTFSNSTSDLTADVGGSGVVVDPATDNLFVSAGPTLTKEFTDDPVSAGGIVTLEFTITNTSATAALSDLEFIDELTTFLAFPVSAALPAGGFCGAGSALALISLGTDQQALSLTGGSLAAAASCTFDVAIDIPSTMPNGVYPNITSPITGVLAGIGSVEGTPASDDLVVVAAPGLQKSFSGPVQPGGTVTLEFTLEHGENAPGDATGISFTDDVAQATLPSGITVVAASLPADGFCGAGSTLTDISGVVTMAGGTLAPGDECSFGVDLLIPATATTGDYTNTTSAVSATVDGAAVSSGPGVADLEVVEIVFTKSFTDDPVLPGGTVTLEFSITNDAPVDATEIDFFDDLDDVLSGLAATGLPASVCGGTLSGTSTLIFSGGSLAAGATCTFSASLSVPAGAVPDDYNNATSALGATLDGNAVAVNPATDVLTVSAAPTLALTKEFTDDPVAPGGTVALEFTIGYDGPSDATGITFTDDLDAALSGLVATGLPANDVCGVGSQLSGTGVLTLTGGSLAPGETCVFSATLAVPGDAPDGLHTNTTSGISGTVDGGAVVGASASDDLETASVRLELAKDFIDDPVEAGSTVTLEFTVSYSGFSDATGISFTDDLEAVLTGLAATGLPASDVCGVGSQLSGTSVLSLTGGSLSSGESCTFSATVLVPGTTLEDDYDNTTSEVTGTVGGQTVTGDPAFDVLTVLPSPDVDPPVITVAEDPIALQPPNHNYHTIEVADFVTDVTDAFDPDVSIDDVIITSVTSDEPEEIPGGADGETFNDMVIPAPCTSVNLRAERQGGQSANGRVYTIHVAATDASGNTGTASFQVWVRKNQNSPVAVDDGPVYTVVGGCG